MFMAMSSTWHASSVTSSAKLGRLWKNLPTSFAMVAAFPDEELLIRFEELIMKVISRSTRLMGTDLSAILALFCWFSMVSDPEL